MKMRLPFLALALVAAAVLTAAASPRRDGAEIHNSGSTNNLGYTIKLWSDGSAQVTRLTRSGDPVGAPSTARIDRSLAKRFFNDAYAVKKAGSIGGGTCMKSASFGSVTTVRYHGFLTGDLECPGNPALASDVHAIAQALGASRIERRPLLPNEHRRPESSPVQPSASPDFVRRVP